MSLEEYNFGSYGLLNEVNYEQIGLSESGISIKLKEANFILLGTLQKREQSIRIDSRLVNIENGKIVSVGTVTLPLTKYTLELYNDFPEVNEIIKGQILANDGWQSIAEGMIDGESIIKVAAEGHWSMTSHNPDSLDANGIEYNPSIMGDYRIYSNFNHGALICRLSTQKDQIFTIGEFSLRGKGIIECRMNDSDIGNNVGSLIVTINIKKIQK